MIMGFLKFGHDIGNLDGNNIQQLDQQIPRWMSKYEVPGVIIAVIEEGMVSWSNAYGVADLEEHAPMTTETVCRVESISKSVTARAIMKLVEEGLINLEDPLVKHIHSWQFPPSEADVQNITIRQLLSHSSGLTLGTLGLEYAPNAIRPTLRESLSKEVKMVHKPGMAFNYSNVSYHLLELLIEDVTGKAYSEYMQEEILDPLGMTDSGFEWREDFITPVPNGYEQNGRPVPVYVYSEKAAGGLFANVEDLAQFVISGMVNEFYFPENVLSEKSLQELYEPVIETAGIYSLVSDTYGLGHFIEDLLGGEKAVFGGGQGHGWMTHFHMLPEKGEGIVILTNSSRSWPLISQILGAWTEGIGIKSVGMELISNAITILWVLNILILVIGLLIASRILIDLQKGSRRFNMRFRTFAFLQYIALFLFVILTSLLIWIQAQDYIFLTSVFPGVGDNTILLLWGLSFVLLLMVFFPKRESHPKYIQE
jgi:CubicO group peptidase (beta-lactamase class C family)